ncbi:hypothetical protein [Actinoplanes couchii]|uniref:hypothetical protein n=1 Tax=Actinoplanes couchii TaxID=403638 RepID=UPI001EF1820A|nr:hypothetical protein [Actinoplanes couchii]MDR6322623.1 hypothetical protein [Actinoplanes couchii]
MTFQPTALPSGQAAFTLPCSTGTALNGGYVLDTADDGMFPYKSFPDNSRGWVLEFSAALTMPASAWAICVR